MLFSQAARRTEKRTRFSVADRRASKRDGASDRSDALLDGGGRLFGCASRRPRSGCEERRVAGEVVVVQEGVVRTVIAAGDRAILAVADIVYPRQGHMADRVGIYPFSGLQPGSLDRVPPPPSSTLESTVTFSTAPKWDTILMAVIGALLGVWPIDIIDVIFTDAHRNCGAMNRDRIRMGILLVGRTGSNCAPRRRRRHLRHRRGESKNSLLRMVASFSTSTMSPLVG